MNEAYEIELTGVTASFITEPFDLVLGVEKLVVMKVPPEVGVEGSTDIEWQIVYARVLVEDRWFFLPQQDYDEIDHAHGDLIGEKLWVLTKLQQ